MDISQIQKKPEYDGKWIAFCPDTGKVVGVAPCVGDYQDLEGNPMPGAISQAIQAKVPKYILHKYPKKRILNPNQ